MLVLTRKEGEQIQIGNDIMLTIVRLSSGQVRLGIEAPKNTPVLRSELKFRTYPPMPELINNAVPYEPAVPVQYAACVSY